jgi:hypothetical protein
MVFIIIFKETLKLILYRLNIKKLSLRTHSQNKFQFTKKKTAQVKKPGYYSHNHR